MSEAAEISIPEISGYDLSAHVGAGGSGLVFRGTRKSSGGEVAVKLLRDVDAAQRERMQSEFRLLSRLEHPQLVHVHDFGYTSDGHAYFAMDWVDGDMLAPAHVRNDEGHLDGERFAELVYHLTAALDFIHSQHIAHGDLKPANILLPQDGAPNALRVMDFGLSSFSSGEQRGLSGTFEYMAPEIIRGALPDAGSDLYALGCILYELASGDPPYRGERPLDVLKQHIEAPLPSIPDETGAPFALWITTLLQKQPQLRYRSAWQLHAQAAEYLGRETAMKRAEETQVLRLLDIPREQERASAMEAWENSRSDSGVLRIEGALGAGKSRFIRDLVTDLQFNGARVERITLRPGQSSFLGVLELIDRGVARSDESTPLLRILASSFPGSISGVEANEEPAASFENEKLRIFHAAAELLTGALGADAVAVDDLHLADALTQQFCASLPSFLEAGKHEGFLLIIGSDPTTESGEPAASGKDMRLRRITLPPLSRQEIADNLAQLLGSVSPSFVEVIVRQSKGMPGRVEDLLNFCVSEQLLEATDHGWLVHERENLGGLFPSSMTQMYTRAIERLGHDARRLLHFLTAARIPLTAGTLAELCERGDTAVFDALAELQHAELVEASPEGLYPAHDAVRDAAGDAGADVHDVLFQWFSAHPPQQDADAVLAHHALHGSDSLRALEPLLTAAEYREQRFDYSSADRFLRDALTLLPTDETDRRFEVLSSLGRLNNILGRRADEEEFLEEMLLLAAQSNSPQRLAGVYRSQTEYYLSTGEFDRARRSAEKALGYYTETGDAMGQAYCHQKIGFVEYRTTPGESVLGHYEKALALFAEQDADTEEGLILIDIGLVHFSVLENPEKAIDHFQQARERFERAGYRRGIIRASGNMGAQYYALGRYEEALERHTEANAVARELGDRRMLATSAGGMGQCEIALCRYSPALLHLEEELRIAREIGDAYLQELCHENLGELYMTLGSYDRAMEMYAAARKLAEGAGSDAGVAADDIDIAGCRIELREYDIAEKLLAQAESLLAKAQDVNISAMLHYRRGMLHLQRGKDNDFEKALSAFNALGDTADRHGFDSLSILARSYAGRCQLQLGRTSIAVDLSTDALAILEEKGPLYGGAHDILLNHALILRASREHAEAAKMIERAHEELMASAESIQDAQLYRSYTENVRVNAEIIREFAVTHRTESPHALTAVREQNLRTLYNVSEKINSVLDLDRLLDNIMDSALEAMNGERGMIFLIENEQLSLKVSRNVEKETIRDATEISLSILQDVLHAGKPIIVSDTASDEEFSRRDSVVNYNIHSLICVPMKMKDEIIGTVYVDSRSDALQAMSFSEIDAEFLEAFANLASIAVENARLHHKLKQENLYLRKEVEQRFGFENIIGSSRPMQQLFSETQAAIGSEGSVLIYGESGTGKELIAKAIHYHGARSAHRFVAVDCGALPDTLLESELFGYKRGAFTGAVADKPGLFEEAHRGTLFLDEISNTSLAFQAKLLRVLQEGEFRRVGETKTRMVNVRVICATNKDLQVEIEAERFRQDLFYRLNVIPITVPPLRQRISDIPELVEHFIQKYNERHASNVHGASGELVEHLKSIPWKGNVRELENLINRMIAQSTEEMLITKMLPSEYTGDAVRRDAGTSGSDLELSLRAPKRLSTLKEMEKEHINFVLKHTDGNKTEAAKILGLKRTTLVERMKKLGMM
ncbi:sigma 54-interacting transcriptional regulator [bacterium]|nr:sigma 54-interacting transcriptional regulator [bacterium]